MPEAGQAQSLLRSSKREILILIEGILAYPQYFFQRLEKLAILYGAGYNFE